MQMLLISKSIEDLQQEHLRAILGVTEQCFAGQGDHVQLSPAGGEAKQKAVLMNPVTCRPSGAAAASQDLHKAVSCRHPLYCAGIHPASSATLHAKASRHACSLLWMMMHQSPCWPTHIAGSESSQSLDSGWLTIIDDHASLAVAGILPVSVHPLGLNVVSRNLSLVMPARDTRSSQSSGLALQQRMVFWFQQAAMT